MSKLIKCICGDSFPIRGEHTIGDHSKECELVLAKKSLKKDMLADDKNEELELFKSDNPPCMCQARYEETRQEFSISSQIVKTAEHKTVFIDFPNFPTRTIHDQKRFWRFIEKLATPTTTFRFYMKHFNKHWLIKTAKFANPNLFKQITLYVVKSHKAPVSRDDILMLKHISTFDGDVAIPIRESGEKYRDLGYHLNGTHSDQCRSSERFGGTGDFQWSVCYLDRKERNNFTDECANMAITGFKPDISFIKY